jgi:limonene-1,2-epoxide hydrolase
MHPQVVPGERATAAPTHSETRHVSIETFMRGYKAAWEGRDEAQFCSLFAADGVYCNTPFAEQRGHAALAAYWQRVKLQQQIEVSYEILAAMPASGLAHWHVTYQVASEELFRIWAASTGTHLPERNSGDPLPRVVLDGVLHAEFDAAGACRRCRIWWHSMMLPQSDAGRS